MSEPILVQIISAPIACENGEKHTWREVAGWAARQLNLQFGERVQVEYRDLFDPACPVLPPEAQLPVVLVNQELLISGGKISVPKIRRRIEAILKQQQA